MRWIYLLLLLSAFIVLLPGSASPGSSLPGSRGNLDAFHTPNFHWLVHREGLTGITASDTLFYPMKEDWLLAAGFPLDALASWPFLALLGWPVGYMLFAVLTIWGVGASMAWLAGRWWRSGAAALVGGVAAQTSLLMTYELNSGRLTQVFGAIGVPLTVGLLTLALAQKSWRHGLGAGVAMGLSALAYWYLGLFLALAALVLVLLTLLERRSPLKALLFTALGVLLVAGAPMAYTVGALDEIRGIQVGLDGRLTNLGANIPLTIFIGSNNLLFNLDDNLGIGAPYLLSLVLVALGFLGRPARRWVAPACWIGMGLVLSIGTFSLLPGYIYLPGPFLALSKLPIFQRFWWPYRMYYLIMLGLALLAAGGAARLMDLLLNRAAVGDLLPRLSRRLRTAPAAMPPTLARRRLAAVLALVLAAGVLSESFALQKNLPVQTIGGAPSKEASILSRGEGPLLLLPFGTAREDQSPTYLLDQIHHGRPLVNGDISPLEAVSPRALKRSPAWPALESLVRCEWRDAGITPINREKVQLSLQATGLKAVHVWTRAISADENLRERYIKCIEVLLGEKYRTEGPYRVYPVLSSSSSRP